MSIRFKNAVSPYEFQGLINNSVKFACDRSEIAIAASSYYRDLAGLLMPSAKEAASVAVNFAWQIAAAINADGEIVIRSNYWCPRTELANDIHDSRVG